MRGLPLYFDEDCLDQRLVDALRARGVDVVTVVEARMTGRSDEEQVAYAASVGRSLYSANVPDFARLHAAAMEAGDWHAGIIVRTWQLMPIGQQLQALLEIVRDETPASMRNRLLYLHQWR